MKSFSDYTADWDYGFDTAQDTPIEAFLPQAVQRLGRAGQRIVAGVRNGTIQTREIRVPLRSLIPTQWAVCQRKVMAMAKLRVEQHRAPIVQQTQNGYLVFDGHHRACAASINQEGSILVKAVQQQQPTE